MTTDGQWGLLPTPRVHTTVNALLLRSYDQFADRPAVAGLDGSTHSYAELRDRALRLAAGLERHGLRRGDRVVVMAKNRNESFEIDHALFLGGFVRVALSYRLHPLEVAGIARDAGARAIIVDEEAAAPVLAAVRDDEGDVVSITFDGVLGDVGYDDLLAAEPTEPVEVDPETIAWMPYTSGTTGDPKGVMISHRALVACMRNLMAELPPISEYDRLLHVAPLTHLSGWIGLLCAMRGARQTTLREFLPEQTLRAIDDHRITVVPMVPTMINALLAPAESGDFDLGSVHTIVYGGSAIAPERLARAIRLFGDVFIQAYGLTEVPFPLTSLSREAHRFDPAAPPPERLGSAGRITPFVELRLVGPEGEDVADGEPGEIWARGDVLMSGYWNRPDDTAAMIDADGWAATGDVGRRVDGYVYIVDRKKDMIVSGGFNIFPREVENAIAALEGVDEVAVIGVPHERWGEAVEAVVVVHSGFEVSADDVVEACRARIASYKKPQSVRFVDELPKTGSGKIMHRSLRDAAWTGHSRRVGG